MGRKRLAHFSSREHQGLPANLQGATSTVSHLAGSGALIAEGAQIPIVFSHKGEVLGGPFVLFALRSAPIVRHPTPATRHCHPLRQPLP